MTQKWLSGLKIAGSFAFMIVFFYLLVVGLSYIESFYTYIGDKVPILGNFIDWARNLLNM